jgi:hypothetical protein
MRIINVDCLKRLGGGVFSTVYHLSPRRVIKVYDKFSKYDMGIIAEEIEMSMCSEYALPVLDVAIATRRKRRYYAVIKKYLPFSVTFREALRFEKILPRRLRFDCHRENVRKDGRGNLFLIDTQGNYAFRRI